MEKSTVAQREEIIFNPNCRILITSKTFLKGGVICLGRQLVCIINFLKALFPEHVWYGADVDGIGENTASSPLRNIQPSLIGTASDFAAYCLKIDQFMSGVFLCIDYRYRTESLQNIELETEDEPYRAIEGIGILLEIRAFDTTYFEIYLT